MIQNWQIRSRAHVCALSSRPFEEGETFYTAIYFDPETSGYMRRDVALDVWKQELSERKPIAYWKTTYSPQIVEEKPEMATKENAMSLLQRFIEEDEPRTENARYILVLMLERKRVLSPTAIKDTETGKMLFYEAKKTGEVFMVRDPELRLDELVQVQDEVAFLLGFGGPAAEAAKTAGMTITPDGKLEKAKKPGKGDKKEVTEATAETPAAGEGATEATPPEGEEAASDAEPEAGEEPPAADDATLEETEAAEAEPEPAAEASTPEASVEDAEHPEAEPSSP